ncbi:hypothetical protein ACHQM5_022106 [Ranunculus cassubicifolius]
MEISAKSQEDGLESEGKEVVIAENSAQPVLRKIKTKRKRGTDKESEEEESSTTPKADDAKIPKSFPCPWAPRKRRSLRKCNFNGVKEFFKPPDLESVFVRHVAT